MTLRDALDRSRQQRAQLQWATAHEYDIIEVSRVDAALVLAWVWTGTTPGHLSKSFRVDVPQVEHWLEEFIDSYDDLRLDWMSA